MTEQQKDFKVVFEVLYTFQTSDKIIFLEELLFYFTLTGRGIWSDGKLNDTEKLQAFKWMNELTHRIWSIRSSLINDQGAEITNRLYENMKFYGEQSNLLATHLVPTIVGAFKNFNSRTGRL